MSNPIDPAFERLVVLEPQIIAALAGKPNEADTRLKVLDRILLEVLNWRHEAIFTEPPTPSGYIDYLLTIGERRGAMVIEAKKAGRLTPATKPKLDVCDSDRPRGQTPVSRHQAGHELCHGERGGHRRRDRWEYLAVLQGVPN
jgi:hypothetical protein